MFVARLTIGISINKERKSLEKEKIFRFLVLVSLRIFFLLLAVDPVKIFSFSFILVSDSGAGVDKIR